MDLTCTDAPGTTAPLESVTIPEIPASTLACNRPVMPQIVVNTINTKQELLKNRPPTTAVSVP